MSDTADTVIGMVCEQMGADREDVTVDSLIVDDLHADSLDCIELVMAFEDEFQIVIPDEEAEKLLTVGQIIEDIDRRVAMMKEAGP